MPTQENRTLLDKMTAEQEEFYNELDQNQSALEEERKARSAAAERFQNENLQGLAASPAGSAGLNNSLLNALAGVKRSSYGVRSVDDRLAQNNNNRQNLLSDLTGRLQQAEQQQIDNEWRQKEFDAKYGQNGQSQMTPDDLLKTRQAIAAQGGDTTVYDQALAQYGIDMTLAKRQQDEAIAIQRKQISDLVGSILNDKQSLKSITGTVQTGGWIPGGSSPAQVQNVKASVDQLIGMLNMDGREKLKGQGTITDREMGILADSLSKLANSKISEEAYIAELERIADVFGGGLDTSPEIVNANGDSIDAYFN